MALIKLTASELENVQSQISKMSGKASDCANTISSVRNNLDMEVAAKRNIEDQLDRINRDLIKYSESLKSHANVLNDVINEFARADSNGSMHQIVSALPSWGNVFGGAAVLGGALGMSKVISNIGRMPMYTDVDPSMWAMQQQIRKVHNILSTVGKSSLKKEETGVFENMWNKGKKAVKSFGNSIKETYGNVVQAGKDCVSWVKKSYQEKGWAYSAVQYGKAAVKVAGGCAALAAVAASGGALAPLAVTYGINDIAGGVIDAVNITQNLKEGKTAEIEETNLLKDSLKVIGETTGSAIGKAVGNEELGSQIGEKAGSLLYTGGKMTTSLYTLSTGWDKIKQAQDFNIQGIASESKSTLGGLYDMATKVDVRDLGYQFELFKQTIPNTVNAAKNFSLISNMSSTLIGGTDGIVQNIAEQWLDGKDFNISGFGINNSDSYLGGLAGQVNSIIDTIKE